MFSSVEGRTVVVTGGTKGIGKGIARVFARSGADVVIVGRDAASGQACADELGALAGAHGIATGSVSFVAADVATLDGCRAAADAAVQRHGGIDVLCANAGIFPDAKIEDMTEADMDAVLGTNVKGTMFAVQACLPSLTASGRGRIVLTSSITGPVTGFPGWSHYGASKAAQLGYMRTAAVELASRGITVNAVLPGNIATEGLADLGPAYRATMEASIPMKRLGEVDDIGYAALFFASDQAAYVTGQALVVDGGQVLPETLEALQ
jgi:3-oxoacyl-[acyl-carrier protein] reductase